MATLYVAHRGGAAQWPENSLTAFRNSIALGARLLELDVHLTADGEIAVIHDPTLDRTTSTTGAVARCTVADLKRARLRDLDGTLTEDCVPTLGEVLALAAPAGVTVLMEIKTPGPAVRYERRGDHVAAVGGPRYEGLEKKVLDALVLAGVSDRSFVMAFNPAVLAEIRTLAPGQPTGGVAPRSAIHRDAPAARRARERTSRALVARRPARCTENRCAESANLQVSKQTEGKGQDEKALEGARADGPAVAAAAGGSGNRMMDRRGFLAGCIALVAVPLAAEAQDAANVPRIGVLFVGPRNDRLASYVKAHEEGLQELGWIRNRSVIIEERFSGTMERMAAAVAELISLNVRAIVTGPNHFIDVAKRATTTVPIVMVYPADPVGQGYVASWRGRAGTSPAWRGTPRRRSAENTSSC